MLGLQGTKDTFCTPVLEQSDLVHTPSLQPRLGSIFQLCRIVS